MNTCALAVSSPRPWYREPWPWLLMAGPAVVVVAGFITLYIALSTDDGVIAEDYYKRGLLVNKQLARVAESEVRHLGAVARITPDGAVRVALTGLAANAVAPAELRLRLVHPTRAGRDRVAKLERNGEGDYAGWVEPPPYARWHVTVEADAWELPTVLTDGRLDDVRFGTASAVR